VVAKLQAEYELELDWRPFYLIWDVPPEGKELPDYILRARANGSEERLLEIAAAYGMGYIPTARIYSTRRAHEATEYARDQGRASEFHHVVFRKVYAEGQDISQWEVLRSAAQEVGLDAADLQRVVDSGQYTDNVAEQVQQAYRIGVSGVPTYVINQRYAIVGAQPYEVFERALKKILNQKS
jgi:predicted DsbA family dithiol-disulfide isomerase